MISNIIKRENRTFWIIIIIYLLTSICLIINPNIKNLTSIYYIDYIFGKYTFIVYFLFSLISFFGLVYDTKKIGLILLVLSQNFLMVSNIGIIVTFFKGQYPGGQYPSGGNSFILIDEISRLLLFFLITLEVIYKWSVVRGNNKQINIIC